jgi:hypothetical protein
MSFRVRAIPFVFPRFTRFTSLSHMLSQAANGRSRHVLDHVLDHVLIESLILWRDVLVSGSIRESSSATGGNQTVQSFSQ